MIKAKPIHIITIILLIVATVSIFVVNSLSAINAYSTTPHKLIVNGKSELSFKPDTAEVCVGVETLNSSVQTAQKENAETMEKVINTLTNNGIETVDIKTTRYNIFNHHNYNNGGEISQAQVSNYVCFKTTDLENLSSLITKLTEAGANAFNGITFSLSDNNEAYNQALTEAINNAKVKANVLAPNAAFNTMDIIEEYSYATSCYFDNFLKTESSLNSINEGEVKICACVKVIFKNKPQLVENFNSAEIVKGNANNALNTENNLTNVNTTNNYESNLTNIEETINQTNLKPAN